MARVKYVEAETAPREVAQLFGVMAERTGRGIFNLWKTVAHAPATLPHLVKLGNAILDKGRLEPRLREMAILRVAALLDCEYERRPHSIFGREVGMTEDQIDGVANWEASTAFDNTQRAILKFTDEMTLASRVQDGTFAELRKYLDEGLMVELAVAVGYYGMIARSILLPFSVDLEPQDIDSSARLLGRKA